MRIRALTTHCSYDAVSGSPDRAISVRSQPGTAMPSQDMNSRVFTDPHGARVSTTGRGSRPWSRKP